MLYRERPVSNTFSKRARAFGNPVSLLKPDPNFKPIPAQYVQPANLVYDLANLLGADKMQTITDAGKIVFHCVGDTGGINGTDIQDEIAALMVSQVTDSAPADAPAFFYHLGDVVYYNGISSDYKPQFYEPYQEYPGPIFAIPGNHDGDNVAEAGDQPDTEPSLTGFFANFCAGTRAPSPDSPYRYTMDQPWPYWTLDTPFATIVGLYSNVDGELDAPGSSSENQPQYSWLVEQFKAADTGKCLVLAVHHPSFSLDTAHGGYQDILDAIDQASTDSGRVPDIVFSGHVHDYQRYTRTVNGKQCPYIIAGAGGYANTLKSTHKLQKDPNTADGIIPKPFQTSRPDVVLENYNTVNPGFLRITIDLQNVTGEYFTGSFDSTPAPTVPFDTFTLNWKAGTIA